jgi:hypothetical protein
MTSCQTQNVEKAGSAQPDTRSVRVLIPVHTVPEVVKLTLGTWLTYYDGSYPAEVVLCLHENYRDYCKREEEILSLPNVRVIRVPEIRHQDHGVMCFSVQHSMALRALLDDARGRAFTHVAVLDQDLVFQDDFIAWSMAQDSDWVLCLFEDRREWKDLIHIKSITFAPKPSVWHTVFSRRVYDIIKENTAVVSPEQIASVMYDTFAKVFEYATCEWGVDVSVFKCAEIAGHVEHLWAASFNYGLLNARRDARDERDAVSKHRQRMAGFKERYESLFPDGIDHLLEKLSAYSCKDSHS